MAKTIFAEANQPNPTLPGGSSLRCVAFDPLELAERLFDLHALVEAIGARVVDVGDELEEEGGEGDPMEPVRRLCRFTARCIEELGIAVSDAPAEKWRQERQQSDDPRKVPA